MSFLEAVILGLVQGLTEFLPISSSGHLEIAKFLLGDDSLGQQSLLMTVTLHAATALATLVVYRKDVGKITSGAVKGNREDVSYLWKIGLSMIPAACVGLFFEHEIEQLFDQDMRFIAMMLVITGLLLLICEWIRTGQRQVTTRHALVIGLAQAIAILPGISRSGATISTALMLGNNKEDAARFSFLMVIPLIFGKMIKEWLDGDFSGDQVELVTLFTGFLVAFLVGWLACKWIIAIVRARKLRYFSFYCFLVAGLLWTLQ